MVASRQTNKQKNKENKHPQQNEFLLNKEVIATIIIFVYSIF